MFAVYRCLGGGVRRQLPCPGPRALGSRPFGATLLTSGESLLSSRQPSHQEIGDAGLGHPVLCSPSPGSSHSVSSVEVSWGTKGT